MVGKRQKRVVVKSVGVRRTDWAEVKDVGVTWGTDFGRGKK